MPTRLRCPGRTRDGLRGRFTLGAGLERLLQGSGCGFRLVDARTVQVLAPTHAAVPPPRTAPGPVASELLVTATKRRLSADQIAAAVSVLPADQLTATLAVDPRRTVGQISGVIMTNLGPGRDKLLMRGLSDGVFTGRARATVGTYLDDTAINYDAPDPDLHLGDLDKVEVLDRFPADTHGPIIYPFALVRGARPEAQAFLQYLKTSPDASATFAHYGFVVLKP